MSLSDFNSIKNLSENEINQKILSLKKELFDLRLRKVTRQSFKPHSFKHIKCTVAQLLTLRSQKKSI
jgi:large subunit ribosomal protein L29